MSLLLPCSLEAMLEHHMQAVAPKCAAPAALPDNLASWYGLVCCSMTALSGSLRAALVFSPAACLERYFPSMSLQCMLALQEAPAGERSSGTEWVREARYIDGGGGIWTAAGVSAGQISQHSETHFCVRVCSLSNVP